MTKYNTQLQSNNIDLQAILNSINELPEAGGSSGDTSIEDALITMTVSSYTNTRVTSIGQGAFAYANSLKSVSFPNVKTISDYAFARCYSLTTANFPTCTTIGSGAFANCTRLTTVSLPVCESIYGSAFRNCYNLSSLTIGLSKSKVCALATSNAFLSTPYNGYKTSFSGMPYIYVPQSLLTSYKNATNWTYFSNYFVGVEGGYIGGGDSGGSSDSNIITFTVEGEEYQAEERMTWGEWVDSEYNTDGYSKHMFGGVVIDDYRCIVSDEYGTSFEDFIVGNHEYYLDYV